MQMVLDVMILQCITCRLCSETLTICFVLTNYKILETNIISSCQVILRFSTSRILEMLLTHVNSYISL